MNPYDYQHDCLNAIENARSQGRRRAYIVMATGLGKTAVSAFEIRTLIKEKKGRVLYLCHQGFILEQAMKTAQAILGDDLTYGRFYAGHNEHTADILFASFQTMHTQRKHFNKDEFSYIIVDETHHVHASTYKPTIDYFNADFMLGLTATPDRMDNLELAAVFDGEAVFELTLPTALRKNYLTSVDYKIITDEIQESRILKRDNKRPISIAELNRTIFIPKRDEDIARIIQGHTSDVENLRMIVFAQNVKHANMMTSYLPGSAVISGSMRRERRQKIMDDFKTGVLQTVIAINIFNEGVDVPEANVIVFLRSTDSKTIFYQQLGRGLRKSEGKDKVRVLDFVANCERIERVIHLSERSSHGDASGSKEAKESFTLNVDTGIFSEREWSLFETIKQARGNFTQRTDEQLLEDLRIASRKLGRPLRVSDMPDYQNYTRRFGSFENAVIKAGLEFGGVKIIRRSNERLLEDLRKKAAELGRTPAYNEIVDDKDIASISLYAKRFGSLKQAILLAGLDLNSQSWSRHQLLKIMRDKAKKLGRAPTQRELRADPLMPGPNIYAREFGGLTIALVSAGLEPTRKKRTENELIEQLQKKYQELGYHPFERDVVRDKNMADPSTYRKVFNMSWVEILNKYISDDFKRSNKPIGKARMLELLADKVKRTGYIPRRRELDADKSLPSSNSIARAFPGLSLVEIFEKAGISRSEYSYRDNHARGVYTKESVTKALLEYASEFGRFPYTSELKTIDKIPAFDTLTKIYGKKYSDIKKELEPLLNKQ